MLRRMMRALAVALLAAQLSPLTIIAASAQELWFDLPDDASAGGKRWTAPDFADLFERNAPWATAASGVHVFMLNNYHATALPEEQFRRIETFLTSHLT